MGIIGTYFTQYEFADAENKVDNELKPFYKPFEELGIKVDYVPDSYNPANNFCEMYYGDYLVGYITPEVDTHEEDSDDLNDFDTHTVWDFDYIDVRITIMVNLVDRYEDTKHFYPKENENDLSDAVQAAKDFIILIKNEQIKKREKKLNEDF